MNCRSLLVEKKVDRLASKNFHFILTLVTLFLVAPAWGAVYSASPARSNASGCGPIGNPCQTINLAGGPMLAIDTMIIQDETYNENIH